MQGYNHVAGGLAFTGIFASFADVNLFSRPEYIGACVFFSLLADVDHTKSPMGKLFYPVAKWLDRHHGHRTVTHSLGFFLALLLVVGVGEKLLTGGRTITGIAALAYGSHLLFDMCTRQGIPLFLPFTRARCVLPGNPNMRLSNRAPLAEVVVFFGFCLLILSTLPLMANGFWVTVNNEFATFSHVLREQNRRPDVLTLATKEGVAGQVVEATASGAVVWDGTQFVTLTEGQDHPAGFRHTARPRRVERLEFVAVGADSLRHILAQPVMAITASGTLPLRFRQAGQQFEQTSLKLDYPKNLQFTVVKPDSATELVQLNRLRGQLAATAAEVVKFQAEQQVKQKRVAAHLAGYATASAYEQGKATEEVTRLRTEMLAAKAPDHTAEDAQTRTEIYRLKAALRTHNPTFTGVATIWKP